MNSEFMWPSLPGDKRPRLFNLLSGLAPKELLTRNKVLAVRDLADALGVSHECVYSWMRRDYLPSKNVRPLVALFPKAAERTLMPYTIR